jgi:hypothetical protein
MANDWGRIGYLAGSLLGLAFDALGDAEGRSRGGSFTTIQLTTDITMTGYSSTAGMTLSNASTTTDYHVDVYYEQPQLATSQTVDSFGSYSLDAGDQITVPLTQTGTYTYACSGISITRKVPTSSLIEHYLKRPTTFTMNARRLFRFANVRTGVPVSFVAFGTNIMMTYNSSTASTPPNFTFSFTYNGALLIDAVRVVATDAARTVVDATGSPTSTSTTAKGSAMSQLTVTLPYSMQTAYGAIPEVDLFVDAAST